MRARLWRSWPHIGETTVPFRLMLHVVMMHMSSSIMYRQTDINAANTNVSSITTKYYIEKQE